MIDYTKNYGRMVRAADSVPKKKRPAAAFTTTLREAFGRAVVRIASPGRNPTKFERQFVTTAMYGLDHGFGAAHNAHGLLPQRAVVAPGSFGG